MNKLLSILFSLLVISCGSQVADTGSGSGLGNPIVVVGFAHNLDGTPAKNAKVTIRPVDYVSGMPLSSFLGEGFDSAGVLYTDSLGAYRGKVLVTGEWNIEVLSNGKAVSIVVAVNTEKEYVPPVTLTVQDTIRGKVLFYGGPASGCQIKRLGSEQVVETSSDGQFVLIVPAGSHGFKCIPHSDAYTPSVIENLHYKTPTTLIRFLAKKPVSKDWICDSLIVRAILDSNQCFAVPTSAVIEKASDRIVQLSIDDKIRYYTTAVFDTIPELLYGLTALTELEIERTSVRALPQEIGSMTKIRELKLGYNKLTTLPFSITKLTLSEGCPLIGNRIRELPPEIAAWATKYDSDWKTTQAVK